MARLAAGALHLPTSHQTRRRKPLQEMDLLLLRQVSGVRLATSLACICTAQFVPTATSTVSVSNTSQGNNPLVFTSTTYPTHTAKVQPLLKELASIHPAAHASNSAASDWLTKLRILTSACCRCC